MKKSDVEALLEESRHSIKEQEARLSELSEKVSESFSILSSAAKKDEMEQMENSVSNKLSEMRNLAEENKAELSKVLFDIREKSVETEKSLENKFAEQEDNVSEIKAAVEKNNAENLKSLENIKSEIEKDKSDLSKEISSVKESALSALSASEENKRIFEERASSIKAEILPEIEKNSSSIESLRAQINSEIESLRDSVNSGFTTIESRLAEIPKELKGETLMKVSPLIDELKKINSEIKKLEVLDARIGMIEGTRYTEEMLVLKAQMENFSLLKAEIEGMKKVHSEIPRELRASSVALDQRIKTLEGKLQKFGVQMLVETGRMSAGHEKKISEVSRSVEDVKLATEKISSADEKLLRLEEQNRLIARTLADNMNVLRDWSGSVEARLAQIFQLQTSLIKELEKARAYQSK